MSDASRVDPATSKSGIQEIAGAAWQQGSVNTDRERIQPEAIDEQTVMLTTETDGDVPAVSTTAELNACNVYIHHTDVCMHKLHTRCVRSATANDVITAGVKSVMSALMAKKRLTVSELHDPASVYSATIAAARRVSDSRLIE